MNGGEVKIKVYSDIEDFSSIKSAIKQIELKNLPVSALFPKRFSVEPNVVLVMQVSDIGSKLLNKFMSIKNSLKNKTIFIIPNSNALLISSIAKLGFTEIFVFPYELYKFISYLQEVISNNMHLTSPTPADSLTSDLYNFDSIIGKSDEFLRVINLAKKIAAKSDVNILIRGETGTGKGVLARAIHNSGSNSSGPFVEIICSSIPENLLESELFGYEPGAFTNARNRKAGLFELAEFGSLFLDEIGDLTINIQKKLLRAIEKKIIRRLGGVSDLPVNARIISATNMDLEALIEKNLFRNDLYHRLNVVPLELPPLRRRGDDVLLLTDYFIKLFNNQFGKSVKRINQEVAEFFLHYSWPGNVRELRNAIERAVLLSSDPVIKLKDLSNLINLKPASNADIIDDIPLLPNYLRMDVNFTEINMKKLSELYAKGVLAKTKGNKSQTARLLGISRPKLDTLLK